MNVRRFSDWWASQDPLNQRSDARADAARAWDAASHAVEAFLIEYAGRTNNDMRRAALECAADNVRYMRSARTCQCCGQTVSDQK